MTRSEDELTRRIYNSQKSNPVKGDWIQYLKEDFELIGEEINEKIAQETSKYEYKKIIKEKIRQKVFHNLKANQESHTKVEDTPYIAF